MRPPVSSVILVSLLLSACHPLSLPWEKKETKSNATLLPAENALGVLIGLNESQVSQRLGLPVRTGDASPATVWEYQRDRCRLTLYFYLDLQTEKKQTLVYDLESEEDTESARRQCVRTFLSYHGN